MFKKALVLAIASAILSEGNCTRIGLAQYHNGNAGQNTFQNYGAFQVPGGRSESSETQIMTEVESVATIVDTPTPLTVSPPTPSTKTPPPPPILT